MQKSEFPKELVNLKIKNKEKLKQVAMYENLTMSDMIDFLIENYEMGLKPHKKLEKLQKQKDEISKQQKELDTQISETNKQISQMEEWREQKTNEKHRAIHTIRRLLVQNRTEEAKISSKNWATITGVPATQLIIEANKSSKVNPDYTEIQE